MAKKTAEQLILELKELFVEREIKYLDKLLTIQTKTLTIEEQSLQEELDAEEMKFLKSLKSRLKYVEDLNNKLTGKTGKEKSKGNEEIWAKIIEMQSSVGKIVQSIPKTGTSE